MAAMLVYTTKECNYNSVVIVHQNGAYDVTCKPRIVQSAIFKYRTVVDVYSWNKINVRPMQMDPTLLGPTML